MNTGGNGIVAARSTLVRQTYAHANKLSVETTLSGTGSGPEFWKGRRDRPPIASHLRISAPPSAVLRTMNSSIASSRSTGMPGSSKFSIVSR